MVIYYGTKIKNINITKKNKSKKKPSHTHTKKHLFTGAVLGDFQWFKMFTSIFLLC